MRALTEIETEVVVGGLKGVNFDSETTTGPTTELKGVNFDFDLGGG